MSILINNKTTGEEIGHIEVDMIAIRNDLREEMDALNKLIGNNPRNTTDRIVIKDTMIAEIREAFKVNPIVLKAMDRDGTELIRANYKAFMESDIIDARIADAMNAKSATGVLLEATAIGKIANKMPVYGKIKATKYELEKVRLTLTKMILDGLSHIGVLLRDINSKAIYDDQGKAGYKTEVTFDFKGSSVDKNITHGIYTVPGVIDTKYINVKAGGKALKISKTQKEYLKRLSSKALRLVRVDEETIKAYYKQSGWYKNIKATQGDHGVEDIITTDDRIDYYLKTIKVLQKQDRLYLTNCFDSRLRVYYTLTMLGINPQGDSFETHMWELADAKTINKKGYEDLVWAAVVIAKGRKNKQQAIKYWNNHEDEVRSILLDDTKTKARIARGTVAKEENSKDKDVFGELFYNGRLLYAIEDYRTKTPSRFILGFDYTTGGLQHLGAAFKSEKAMKLSNIGGLKTVKDAHGELGKEFGLPRSIAKSINTPLLHGSSYDSIAKRLHIEGVEITQEEVRNHCTKTYGNEILNIAKIVDFGDYAYDMNNTTLLFTTPDGEKAQSVCYIKGAILDIVAVTALTVKGTSRCTIVRDMPYYVVETKRGKEQIHENSKRKGLFANITHAIDGWTLRQMDAMLYKHDKFYTHPNDMEQIRETGRRCAAERVNSNYYATAISDIQNMYVGDTELPTPELIIGKGTEAMIAKSNNFLMP